MKYIDVRYDKICQWVVDDTVIDLVKISMKKNPADMITKTPGGEVQSISELHQGSSKVK